jgi:hypothetical protein
MRRRLIQFGLFVFAGAIVNVAVAWGCALWSPIGPSEPVEVSTVSLDFRQPALTSRGFVAERASAFGRVDILVDDPGIDDQPAIRMGAVGQQRIAGWPMLCLQGSAIRTWADPSMPLDERTKQHYLVLPPKALHRTIVEMRGIKIIGLQPWIPLRPLWPGFVINTLFYAGILWLLFAAPFALRRRRRIKRVLCPACAYPVGASDICTECGKPVKPRGDTRSAARGLWFMLAAFGLLLAGCQAKPKTKPTPADLVLNIHPGLERVEVERRLGQSGGHQATASVDGVEVVVTSHALDPWLPLHYIYRDGRLERIVEPTRSRTHVSSFEGTPWIKPLPADPEQRLQAVLAGPPLSNETIAERIAARRRDEAYAKQFHEGGALLLAVVVTAPLYPLALPRIMKQNALERELAARFDPWKIRLNMTVTEVDAIYGPPKGVRQTGETAVHAYGEPVSLTQSRQRRFSWVAVHFKDGVVTRVFSHGFFDYSLISPVRKTYEDDDGLID